MSAHTEGPWLVTGPYPITGGGRAFAVQSEDLTVALITANGDDEPQSKTDANLIAAAPELLKALRDVVRAYENSVGTTTPSTLAARSAIAKAEGK